MAAASNQRQLEPRRPKVGIGGSIFLIALGAILAFAVDVSLGWLNLSVVGWVLILVGVIGLIMTAWFWQSRRRTVVREPVVREQVVQEPVIPVQNDRVVEEYREVRRPGRPI
jgi:membrane protein implicated in regulation of membrane protease activity